MDSDFLRYLAAHGFMLDANGRAVPIVVGPDPFAVPLMPMRLPTLPEGPSKKTLRRRAKLALHGGSMAGLRP